MNVVVLLLLFFAVLASAFLTCDIFCTQKKVCSHSGIKPKRDEDT